MSIFFKIKFNAAVASLSAFVVMGLAAQDKPFTPAIAPTGQTQQLERVLVIGVQNGDDRRESTASKIVVTRDDISRFGDTTVADVLRRVPGVTVGGVQGRDGEIRMRGLGNGYTQILVNGESTPPGFSFNSLSPSLIERIEVLRVATADISAQAIAGTINIILKQAIRQVQREIKASVAGYGDNPSAFLDGQMSDQEGVLSYTLAGGLSRQKNTWPALIEQRGQDAQGSPNLVRTTAKTEYGQNDTFNFAPRLNWKLASDDMLSSETLFQYRSLNAETVDKRVTTLGLPPLYAADDLQMPWRNTFGGFV